jgi:oligopeptide/dipeptide ABC transporter ATP-binding protein
MYLGRIVEIGPTSDIFKNSKHPYTEALIQSVPSFSKKSKKIKRDTLKGEPPSPINPPPGCSFHPRCKYAQKICEKKTPLLEENGENREVACYFPL